MHSRMGLTSLSSVRPAFLRETPGKLPLTAPAGIRRPAGGDDRTSRPPRPHSRAGAWLSESFERPVAVREQPVLIKPQLFHLKQDGRLTGQPFPIGGIQLVVETAQAGFVQHRFAADLVAEVGVCNPAPAQHDTLDIRERLTELLIVRNREQVAVVAHRMAADRERLAECVPVRLAGVEILLHARMDDNFGQRIAVVNV